MPILADGRRFIKVATKQKSGLYRTKIKIGVDENGKDIVKWISGKTKRELEEARREAEEYYVSGTGLREDRLLGEFTKEWFTVRKAPFITPSTRKSYRTMLNHHLLPAFGERNLRAIRSVELQKWLNSFAGKSETTIMLAITVVRAIMKAACADQILARNPAEFLTQPKAAPEKTRRALTKEEDTSIKRVIKKHERGDYLAAMYYLGVRPGEARGLKWCDFDWENNLVHIQRDIDYTVKGDQTGALKSEAADRYVPVPSELRKMLFPSCGNPEDFLFQGTRSRQPLSKASAERLWLDFMQMANLTVKREKKWKSGDMRAEFVPLITPHYLRHNYITKCWSAGLDPLVTMRIVGHSDYRTTANIYTHLNNEHLKKARLSIDNVFSDQPSRKVARKLHKSPGGQTGVKKEPSKSQ